MSDTSKASTPTAIPPCPQPSASCTTGNPLSLFTAEELQDLSKCVSPARVKQVVMRSVASEASRTNLLSEMDPKLRWTIKCASCVQAITLRQSDQGCVIEALGRLWHRDHFNCVKCNTALGANNIDFRPLGPYGDSPICVDCYMDMYHPKCAGCDLPLRETCVEAEQKQWHQSCFKCRRCNSPIGVDAYYLWEGKVYDCDCFHLRKYRKELQREQKSETPSPSQNACATDSSSSAALTNSSSSAATTTTTSSTTPASSASSTSSSSTGGSASNGAPNITAPQEGSVAATAQVPTNANGAAAATPQNAQGSVVAKNP